MTTSDKAVKPPLVLIANEQEWSARSLETILGPSGFAVLRAYTGKQALDLARSAHPDIVLVDARMPDMDGLDVCQLLREDPRFSPATPIIVTSSGPAARAQRLAALRAGAWDYFTQPLDGEVLLLKLWTYSRAKQSADSMRDESLLDNTTGLYNIRGLARRAREIGADAFRRRDPLACVAFAPSVGEDLTPDPEELALRMAMHLGDVCRASGRVSDAIGRIGLTEYAIIAPGTDGDAAVRMIERLRTSIAKAPFSNQGATSVMDIRAGYCAVDDFSTVPIDAVEMLFRATTALRHLRDDTNARHIRAFEERESRREEIGLGAGS
jgi:PleD family two-component response regulator